MIRYLVTFILVQIVTACASTPKPISEPQALCKNEKPLVKPTVLFRTYVKTPKEIPLDSIGRLNESMNHFREYLSEEYFTQSAIYGKLVGGSFETISIIPDENKDSTYYIFIGQLPNPNSGIQISRQMPGSLSMVHTKHIRAGDLYSFFKNNYFPQALSTDQNEFLKSLINQSLTITKSANETWAETLVTLDLTRICKDARNRDELFSH